MSIQELPSVKGMAEAVALFAAARPDDAESLLTGPLAQAEVAWAGALSGRTYGADVRHAAARRRLASWRLEVLRALDAGDEPEGPRLPEATVEDHLGAWARRHGAQAAGRAVASLTAESDQLQAKAQQARAGLGPGTYGQWLASQEEPGQILKALDDLALRLDQIDAWDARVAAMAAARDRIAARLATLFGAAVKADRAGLEAAAKTAAALASDVVDSDPTVQAMRGRQAEIEAELGRLAAVGVKVGLVSSEAGDELTRIKADLKVRSRALTDAVALDAAGMLDGAAAGGPGSVARLATMARDNPRAFGPDAYDRLLDLIAEAVQAGGDAAASVLCPAD